VASTVPALELLDDDAFNVLGDAGLGQSSLDAGNFWCDACVSTEWTPSGSC
jgi:hypothetical protein